MSYCWQRHVQGLSSVAGMHEEISFAGIGGITNEIMIDRTSSEATSGWGFRTIVTSLCLRNEGLVSIVRTWN